MKTAAACSIQIMFCLCWLVSCQDHDQQKLAEIQTVVERIGKRYVPDSRVDIFQVEIKAQGDSLHLHGEVLNPALPGVLLDSLQAIFPGEKFAHFIQTLPENSFGDSAYGIVNVSVANIYKQPKHQAELVNQALLGSVVRLLKEDNGFYYIQNSDLYLGWLTRHSVAAVDSAATASWQQAERVICLANYGVVTQTPDNPAGEILTDLTTGAALKFTGRQRGYLQVELPDGRAGFVKEEWVIGEEQLKKNPATPENIMLTSKKFLGVPYLWGGASSKGFDCSGFTQTVFRLNNLQLPRDASQQVREGSEIQPGEQFENLLPGDLLFFGSQPEKISHVAIYMGDQLYIHSSTSVHINSLDKHHPLFSEYRYKTFQKAKRIL